MITAEVKKCGAVSLNTLLSSTFKLVSSALIFCVIFANCLRDGKRALVFSDGEQCRDFVHVSDVVQGFLAR